MSFLRDIGGKLIPAIPVIGQVYEVARYLHNQELPGGTGPAFGGSSAGASIEDVVASGILTTYAGPPAPPAPPSTPYDPGGSSLGPKDPATDIPDVTFPPVGPPYTDTDESDPGYYGSAMTPVPPPGVTDVIPPTTPPGRLPNDYPGVSGGGQGDVIVTPGHDYGPVDPRIFRQRRGRRHTSPDATAPPGVPTMPRGNPTGPHGDAPGMMMPPPRGFIPGRVYGRKTQLPRAPRGRVPPYTFPSPFPNAVPAPAPRPPDSDEDTPDRERPPLFPPDTEEPANDTSIRRPPQPQVEPVRVPDPAGVRAPFPQQPPRVELPGVPPVTVPKPEIPKWPASQPYSPPSAAPAGSAVSLPRSVPGSSAPSSPQTIPSTTFPRPAVAIGLPLALLELLSLLRGNARTASPSSAIGTTTGVGTFPELNPFQALPRARPSPATALTPGTATGVESAPSCETPSQTRQRRENQKQNCERFITVVVPRHHRRVCAAEAGRLIGKKIGRKIGTLVGRKVRGVLKKAGVPLAKLPKRKRIPRSIEIGGGFGVELPRMPGSPR